jgi:glycosyltransferase involved in cell wall biosynthesis
MPEYINAKFPFVPKTLVYKYMRSLHENSSNVLVTSGSMEHELKQKKFKNKFTVWSRGVDSSIFNSSSKAKTIYRRPYLLYVGRVSVEKNIEAFLSLNSPEHDKVVVGNGPDLARLQKQYSGRDDIIFAGAQFGKDLASWYAGADCFVFPSKTDTYGIVMIESLCCGTPVAGYTVTGPMDVLVRPEFGEAFDNLDHAVYCILCDLKFYDCEKMAQEMFSWDKCVDIFINSLVVKQ